MVTPVKLGTQYYETANEQHYEGLVDTRAEVELFETEPWAVGSVLVCSEDWSVWVLSLDSENKAWKEVTQ